jgi:hypothetical protein
MKMNALKLHSQSLDFECTLLWPNQRALVQSIGRDKRTRSNHCMARMILNFFVHLFLLPIGICISCRLGVLHARHARPRASQVLHANEVPHGFYWQDERSHPQHHHDQDIGNFCGLERERSGGRWIQGSAQHHADDVASTSSAVLRGQHPGSQPESHGPQDSGLHIVLLAPVGGVPQHGVPYAAVV